MDLIFFILFYFILFALQKEQKCTLKIIQKVASETMCWHCVRMSLCHFSSEIVIPL